MNKYSQDYTLKKPKRMTGIAEGLVALLIFATAFVWLFL